MASVHHHLLVFLSIFAAAAAAEPRGNITLNSSLSASAAGKLSWLSPSGDFAFGFLPLPTNSSLFLLAVYFAKLPKNTTTVIWSPNRNKPVSANSTVILTPDGQLSLHDPSGAEAWNSGARTAAYASMLDTGDFALATANGSFLWDTFASPMDTIVPSQSLGPNSKLISKLAADDFSDGRFKLAVQNGAGDLIFHPIAVPTGFEYTPYWSSKSNTPNSSLDFNISGSIDVVSPKGELITTLTSATMKPTADFYHRGTLDPDGVFRHYVHPRPSAENGGAAEWTVADFKPADICRVLLTTVGSGACGFNSFCGYDNKGMVACECPEMYSWVDPNRTYMGCKPDFAMPSCIAGAQGGVFRMARVENLDFSGDDYDQFNPMEEAECEQQCMDDCFCAASIHDGITTCWNKKLPFSNGRKGSYVNRIAFIKVSKGTIPILPVSEKRNWSLPGSLALGGSVLLNFTFLSAIFVILRVSKRKQRKKLKDSILGPNLKLFTYEELQEATNGFGVELGRGACGTVYKGYLGPELTSAPDIAVKKLRDFQPEMEKEFANEVKSISQTHHKNLVRLLGYCNQGAERLLVYEFLSNGSLASYLFHGSLPPWEQRVEIVFGIARGLRYLHDECGAQIIHCDIKPQNVLLDGSFVARIADFGLAKLLMTEQTRTNTGIRGTKGYVAPEWFKSSGITAKVDVYSFGVMVLEIVCCRRNVEKEVGEEKAVLAFWASDCFRDGRVDLLVEGDLEAMGDMGRVERFVKVALWCVEEDPSLRPTMALVTQMLEGAVEIPSPESHKEM